MNFPVDQKLFHLVDSLENDVKNWSEELKEERDKVQHQLQIFCSEIKQRLARLETEQHSLKTGQQKVETGHQRLETEQQRLETEQQRLETEQQRLETEQQRLDSRSRDVEQRVIKCEGTPTL